MRKRSCVRVATCSQGSDNHHGLSLTTSGVRSCLLGSGTFWLHNMMFQTSTYTSICMSICMCVCSVVCLHRCMFMSRTHNTHIHAHIHAHTRHTIMNFPHDSSSTNISFKVGPKHLNYSDESALRSLIPNPFTLLRFVLYFCVCLHVCIRVYFQ